MVEEFAKFNKANGKKTVVVVSAPGETFLPWDTSVDAQLMNFYAGE